MFQEVILLGRVGKDPEVRQTSAGKFVANITLATSESWKDRNGQKQEKTEWHNVVVFGMLAEILGQKVQKGDQLFVKGKLQTNQYQDRHGVTKYSTKIVASIVRHFVKDDHGQQVQSGKDYDFGPEPSFDDQEEIPF